MLLRSVLAFVMLVLVCATASAAEPVVPQSRAEISLSFAPVIKKAAPAVVNITPARSCASVLSAR